MSVHPRVCGADSPKPFKSAIITGSSPRVRGGYFLTCMSTEQ